MTRVLLQLAASAGLLASALAFVTLYSHGEAVALRRPLGELPPVIGGWTMTAESDFSEPVLEQLRPTDYLLRRYEDGNGRGLWLYVAYWSSQRRGAQIHSPKHCLPGGGWQPLEASTARVPAGAGESIEANRFVVQKGSEQQVVLYWFQSQGETVAGELEAKLLLLRNAMLHGRTDAAIVRLSAPVEGTVAEASTRLVRWAAALVPELRRALPRAGAGEPSS